MERGQGPEVRVILVGRTGLDGPLRLDQGLDIVRVRSPLEAVAELASPLEDQTQIPTAVVLGPDAQRAVLAFADGADGAGASARERVGAYLRSLREIDARVRVLGVTEGATVAGQDLYDAIITAGLGTEALRAAMRAETGAEPGENQAATPPVAGAPGATPVSDLALVELVLQGRDVLPAALAGVRARLNDAALEFIDPDAGRVAPKGGTLVPVAWGEAILGYLAPSKPHARLPDEARWLGGWLRLRDQQNQLRHAAFTDPLTGAWNRRYFERFLALAIDTAREHRWNVTVLVFDIDNFKRYNDAHGHEAGDDILRETVRLLSSVIRPSDRVCRIGGDEFAVIFHEPRGPRKPDSKHPASVFDIAQRFQAKVNSAQFPKLGVAAPGQLTISGGLATFPWDGNSPEELLNRADQLALASKRQGKNVITIGAGTLRADRER